MTLFLQERSSLGKSQPGAAVLGEKGKGLLICFVLAVLTLSWVGQEVGRQHNISGYCL